MALRMTSNKVISKSSTLSGHSKLAPILRTALVQNRQKFLRFLNRRVGNMDIAEEILQQFFIRALNKGGALKNPESVVAWLYRVLNSALTDFYRSEAKRHQGEADYARLASDHLQELDVNPVTVCACIYALIPTLKAEYSEIFQRIDLKGESHAKVASDMRITVNLVRVRLHRARQALKKALLMSCCKSCHEHGFMHCECTHVVKEH